MHLYGYLVLDSPDVVPRRGYLGGSNAILLAYTNQRCEGLGRACSDGRKVLVPLIDQKIPRWDQPDIRRGPECAARDFDVFY
jgi:hypothetical protein